MAASLQAWLSVAGLTFDFVGAAFLAYDVLAGPEARHQAAIRRQRLEMANESKAIHERRLRELEQAPQTPLQAERLQKQTMSLTNAIDKTLAEIRHWEEHERRAHVHALVGLLLLMTGFACQAVGAVLAAVASAAT